VSPSSSRIEASVIVTVRNNEIAKGAARRGVIVSDAIERGAAVSGTTTRDVMSAITMRSRAAMRDVSHHKTRRSLVICDLHSRSNAIH